MRGNRFPMMFIGRAWRRVADDGAAAAHRRAAEEPGEWRRWAFLGGVVGQHYLVSFFLRLAAALPPPLDPRGPGPPGWRGFAAPPGPPATRMGRDVSVVGRGRGGAGLRRGCRRVGLARGVVDGGGV